MISRLKFILIAAIFFTSSANAAPVITLSADKFSPGESIIIKVTNLPGNPQDWLTLVKVSAPASKFGEWSYTKGVTEGTWTFSAPQRPGDYEVRVFFDYPAGGETIHARAAVKVIAKKKSPPQTTVQAAKPESKTAPTMTSEQSQNLEAYKNLWEQQLQNKQGNKQESDQTTKAKKPALKATSPKPDVSVTAKAPNTVQSQTPAKSSTPFDTANFVGTLVHLLGKPLASADGLVKQLGYKLAVSHSFCLYQQYSSGVSRSIQISTASRKCNDGSSLVTEIQATESISLTGQEIFSTRAEIDDLNREIQAESECTQLTERVASCAWQVPPSMPMLQKLVVQLQFLGLVNTRRYSMQAANAAQATSSKAVGSSASAVPTEDAAVSKSKATSSATYFFGVIDDLLSDKEFRNGIPATQLNAFLQGRGFVRAPRKVQFYWSDKRGRTLVNVRFSCNGVEECFDPNGIVEDIFISGTAIPSAETPPNMSSILAKHFSLEPKCKINNGRGPENAFGKTGPINCYWDLVPGQHRFRALRLAGNESGFLMALFSGQ